MSNEAPVKLKATVMYPYFNRLNDKFNADNPKYEVTLANLSDAAVAKLKSMGIKTYSKEGMGQKITCKSISEIHAYDQETAERIDGDIIGNGSECIAVISSYTNGYGSFPQLNKIVITKLEKYEASSGVGINADDDDIL